MLNRNFWGDAVLSASVCLIILLCSAAPVSGHGLEIDCHVESDGRILVAVRHDAGEPAAGAKVRWLDEAGTVLGQASTDDQGRCTIEPQAPAPHRVEAVISGHRAEYVFPPAGANADPGRDHAHESPDQAARGLAGLAIILSAAAMLMVVKQRKVIRQFERQVERQIKEAP